MESFIKQCIKDREKNLISLNKGKQNIMDEIKQIRSQINSHLDTLEKTFMKTLTASHAKTALNIKAKIKQLSEKSTKIAKLKDNLLAVKEYGSDLQAFFGVRRIDNEVKKAEIYLKATLRDTNFCHAKIIRKIDQKITDIFALTTLGNIDIDIDLSSLVYKPREEKRAQIMTAVNQDALKSIDNIHLKLMSTFNISTWKRRICVRGCTICPDGKMIFTDSGNHCLVFVNSDNSFAQDILIGGVLGPYDVTVIDQETVAVTTGGGIKIIDIYSKKIKENIDTEHGCFGITCDKDSLLWCEKNRGIKKMTLPNKIVFTVLEWDIPNIWSFLETYGNKVYFTSYVEKTVECLTIAGKLKWKFKDVSILNDPTCISVDNNMFVYTTSGKSNNVVVISPYGNKRRELLSSKDGMSSPRGICFDRRRNNLLVVNDNGTAFLYHVK